MAESFQSTPNFRRSAELPPAFLELPGAGTVVRVDTIRMVQKGMNGTADIYVDGREDPIHAHGDYRKWESLPERFQNWSTYEQTIQILEWLGQPAVYLEGR